MAASVSVTPVGWLRSHTHRKIKAAALTPRAFDLLCVTVAAVLALHARHMQWWLTGMLVLLLAMRWWQRHHYAVHLAWWVRLPLTLLLPAVVIAIYGTLFGRYPGSVLAVGLLVLKTLESETTRDAHAGIAFACFVLMAALLFGQGMVMTAAVMLALVPALACLVALQPGYRPASWWVRLVPIGKAMLLAAPLALLAFVLLPRLRSPLWGPPPPSNIATTGISDTMAPAGFTHLLVNDSPAFRVHFDGAVPPRSERYFRGPVLWWFDGRTWQRSRPGIHYARRLPPEQMAYGGPVYRYQITLEPTQQHWIFALDTPLAPPSGMHMRAARTLWRTQTVESLLRYDVASAPRHILAPRLTTLNRWRALELPTGFDPKARALAASWEREYGHDAAAIVTAALSMYRDHDFVYTLNPAPLGRNSVDDFLFSTREGFCVQYASSFTFLMRAAGVPARVVIGYQGGYWNQDAGYLLVRQSNAHAWSEVWMAGRGWVRIDPTAAASPRRITLGPISAAGSSAAWYQGGWLGTLRNHWDIVNHWWNDTVIGFDALRQQHLLRPFGIGKTTGAMLLLALAASVVLTLLVAGVVVLRSGRRQRDRLTGAMALLRRRLTHAGVTDRPGEGPRDFFARAARELPYKREALDALGQAWIRLRYVEVHPAPATIRAFCRAARNFHPRRAVR